MNNEKIIILYFILVFCIGAIGATLLNYVSDPLYYQIGKYVFGLLVGLLCIWTLKKINY